MPYTLIKKPLSLALSLVFLAVASFAFVPAASAQTSGSSCPAPNFEITSSSDVLALSGESFSYYVVTQNDTNFDVSSQLPAGVSFQGDQLTGTPQAPGEYEITFTAQNECGTTNQSVMLNVVAASGQSNNQLAQSPDAEQSAGAGTQGSESNQSAAAGQNNVSLDEIPDTGATADTIMTILLYAFALLVVGVFAARRLTSRLSFTSGRRKEGSSSKVGNGINN